VTQLVVYPAFDGSICRRTTPVDNMLFLSQITCLRMALRKSMFMALAFSI